MGSRLFSLAVGLLLSVITTGQVWGDEFEESLTLLEEASALEATWKSTLVPGADADAYRRCENFRKAFVDNLGADYVGPPMKKVRGLLGTWKSLTKDREWVDASGKHSTRAAYVTHNDESLTLERDGKKIIVALEKLDEQGRKRVAAIAKTRATIIETAQPGLTRLRRAQEEDKARNMVNKRVEELVSEIVRSPTRENLNLRWLLVRLSGSEWDQPKVLSTESGLERRFERPTYRGPIAAAEYGALKWLADDLHSEAKGGKYRASAQLHLVAIGFAVQAFRDNSFKGLKGEGDERRTPGQDTEQDMALYGLDITAYLPIYDAKTGEEVAKSLRVRLNPPDFDDEPSRLFSFTFPVLSILGAPPSAFTSGEAALTQLRQWPRRWEPQDIGGGEKEEKRG